MDYKRRGECQNLGKIMEFSIHKNRLLWNRCAARKLKELQMRNKADFYKKDGKSEKGKEVKPLKMAKNTNQRPRVEQNTHHKKFYSTAIWQKTRASYLKEQPVCERCKEQGKLVPAYIVHHRKPLENGGEQLDHDNLKSLCSELCHRAEHTEIERLQQLHGVDDVEY